MKKYNHTSIKISKPVIWYCNRITGLIVSSNNISWYYNKITQERYCIIYINNHDKHMYKENAFNEEFVIYKNFDERINDNKRIYPNNLIEKEIKGYKLMTYDIVPDPGFSSSKLSKNIGMLYE